ncbi:hypothetical protein Hanom_Chr11g01022521 [Helianthus anomalus]
MTPSHLKYLHTTNKQTPPLSLFQVQRTQEPASFSDVPISGDTPPFLNRGRPPPFLVAAYIIRDNNTTTGGGAVVGVAG